MPQIDDLFFRLEKLNAIGASLSQERNIDRLLDQILIAAKDITHADGGTLYRVTEDGQALRFEIMRNASLGIALGGISGQSIDYPVLPLRDEAGRPNNTNVAAYAVLQDATVNIADAYSQHGFDFSGTRAFDERMGYRSESFLTVPLKNHESKVIGVLQLINCISPESGKVVPFDAADQRLTESLASQVAIALTNRQLINQVEGLFESFINLINLAIDEKSPYTGGHCQRVPALTMMLADAVDATTEGPFADFHMSDQDRYELKIAGLLHDCGKVTTPVHVVDKATKLQTLFDRIHLIDTRFEVLKRDMELHALKKLLAMREVSNPDAEQLVWLELRDAQREADDDREALRQANIGSEAMTTEDQQRVRDIGLNYQWRNVDGVATQFLTTDEIENLTIRSGTLTAAEREIINYHIVATNKMLERLPWPQHLKNVPEYAGGHHERMDGKGYPKGLTKDQMSIQARIMGIADIFEALTAKDRPYKAGMKLSEAVAILARFASNGHIDSDLFNVFLSHQVYRKYAAVFLDPSQLDAPDQDLMQSFVK